MFRDERRDKVWNEIRQLDLRSLAGLLTSQVFQEASLAAGVRIGCSALNLTNLVWLGIACGMDRLKSFSLVLTATMKILADAENCSSPLLGRKQRAAKKRRGRRRKHDPRGNDPTQVTEEAFAQARQRMPLEFWMALLLILARRFQREHMKHVQFRGFRLLAIDGTTLSLDKSEALYRHYGSQKNGSARKAPPQARLVMITLPGTRVPLAYRVSPLRDSEVTLAQQLAGYLQPNDLLLMDRGFISYGWFWEIQRKSAYFATRRRANMNLRRVCALGPQDALYDWRPKDSRGNWKHLPKSIRLRVIKYRMPGFRPTAIVTNVLDPRRVSREDWVRVAVDCDRGGRFTPGLYHRRWEIETSYGELKVVLKADALRSRTPKAVEYELAGRIVYYLLLRWLIVRAAEKYDLDPLRISFTNALGELETMRPLFLVSTPQHVCQVLLSRLLERIASHLVPQRPGRSYPRNKDDHPRIQRRTRKRAQQHTTHNATHCRSRTKARCPKDKRTPHLKA